MSIVEQRYQAVMAVLAGDPVVGDSGQGGASRQSVHAWLRRYADEGMPRGLRLTDEPKRHPEADADGRYAWTLPLEGGD